MSLSLWLSRVTFSRARPLYAVHAALWRAFAPLDVPGEPRPFLFRCDIDAAGRLRALVQSVREPAWDRLGAELAEASGPKPLSINPAPGRAYRFFLRANTTVCRKYGPRFASLSGAEYRAVRGLRVGLARDEDRVAWLVRKGAAGGFQVAERADGRLGLELGAPFVERWQREGARRKDGARHDGVDFEGRLVVVDPDRFVRAVELGLGPAKAFGFGMLSLAPA